jgi:hypothetical protein
MMRDTYEKRIRDLERALAPFAKEAGCWSDKVPNSYRPGMTEPKARTFDARAEFTIGHLRRARALLGKD